MRAWAALRDSSAEGWFEAFHASGLTELVGREEELDLLLRRWSKAKTGGGQVVLLTGEPGIGKSRLTAALFERVAAEPHIRLRYFCSPQHTDSAFYPIISQMDASLMARLDRLGSAKEVAQIGAAIGREFPHALLAAVVRKTEAELGSALDRLTVAGLLLRQGVPPHASYLFKHALVQDAAYGTLLREPRRALQGRIAETLESQFAEVAESQPELLARHCTEAGLIDKAATFWGKAGQRSVERSALVEGAWQLTRALDQISALPKTPALRRDEIKYQVALITPLIHVKGYAAPETRAAIDRAHLLLKQVDALGETPEDPLLLFSVLYGFWAANFVAFNGDALRELAAQFLALAEKQGATGPIMIGHRLMASSLMGIGDTVEGRKHYDRAMALYDPAEHRSLATRFGQDLGVVILTFRSWVLWLLGYPEGARRDAERALKDAREIGQAATLMYALFSVTWTYIHYGNYAAANALADELVAVADQKGALFWKAFGMLHEGRVLALTGQTSDAVHILGSAITALRSTGATLWMPSQLSYLARAYAELGQFDELGAVLAKLRLRWKQQRKPCSRLRSIALQGKYALLSPEPNAAKAEAYFGCALTVAHKQQAKS